MSIKTETQATNFITEAFNASPSLFAYIDSNDRTPLTDGHVDIVDPQSNSSKTILGRVPIQVKGRRVSGRKRDPKRFPVSRVELNAYLRMSGVLFIVVAIDAGTDERRPYYANLSPFRIQEILDGAPAKKDDLKVPLRELPSAVGALEDVVAIAVHAQKENPNAAIDIGAFENIESFTIFAGRDNDMSRPISFRRAERDFTLSVRTGDGLSTFVGGRLELFPPDYVEHDIELEVGAGEFQFRNPRRRRVDDSTVELRLSEGLVLNLRDPKRTLEGELSVTASNNLETRWKDLGFFLTCKNGAQVEFNQQPTPLNIGDFDDSEALEAHFRELGQLRRLVVDVGADPALIDLDGVDDEQLGQLQNLFHAVVEGREVEANLEAPGRIRQRIGEWSLELVMLQGDTDGTWNCVNLFSPDRNLHFVAQIDAGSGDPSIVRVTPFELIDPELLPSVINLDLNNVSAYYENIAGDSGATDRANQMVVGFIGASDLCHRRRVEFLAAAADLNDWLIEKEGNKPFHLVNMWQIGARRGVLGEADLADIRSLRREAIRESVKYPTQIEAACAILLGNREDFEESVDRLSGIERDEFQKWPIVNLLEALAPCEEMGFAKG